MQRSSTNTLKTNSGKSRTATEDPHPAAGLNRLLGDSPADESGSGPESGLEQELSLSNARLVLRGEVVSGSIHIADGKIQSVDSGPSAVGEDLQQDYLLPGLIELHTDHIESHFLSLIHI